MLGPREIVVVALVALALYGRSGVLRTPRGRGGRPWPWPSAKGRRRGDRGFWFLTIVAAAAVAAWIVTRTLILGTAAPGIPH